MNLKTKGVRDMIMDPCWRELVAGDFREEDGKFIPCAAIGIMDVTPNGTSVSSDSYDPKNGGSKPELNWQEDYY